MSGQIHWGTISNWLGVGLVLRSLSFDTKIMQVSLSKI